MPSGSPVQSRRRCGRGEPSLLAQIGAGRAGAGLGWGSPFSPGAIFADFRPCADYQFTGQPVLIGGTMGTCSYVLTGTDKASPLSLPRAGFRGAGAPSSDEGTDFRGKGRMTDFRSACVRACQGMAETFGSTCHGAGRAQSRNRSRNNLSYEDVLASLASTHAYADAHRCGSHICAGTGVAPPTSVPGLGPPPPTSAPGLGPDHAASAPGMATPLPTSAA